MNLKNDPNGNISLKIFSSFRYILSSQIHGTAGCEAQKSMKFIALSSTVGSAGHKAFWPLPLPFHRLNIKFYVSGVVDVPRMWIDRCIKQPSKPISSETNASKGLLSLHVSYCLQLKTSPHIMCVLKIEHPMVQPMGRAP